MNYVYTSYKFRRRKKELPFPVVPGIYLFISRDTRQNWFCNSARQQGRMVEVTWLGEGGRELIARELLYMATRGRGYNLIPATAPVLRVSC